MFYEKLFQNLWTRSLSPKFCPGREKRKYYFYFHIYNRARIFSLNESERKVSDISMASLKVETKQVSIVEILCSLNDLICEKYDGMYISASFK